MTAAKNEPVVLPGAFPNLLANGSQGIAVGMATVDPAAQCRRTLRRGAVPDRQSECAQPHAAEIRAGSGFSDRRRDRRSARGDRRSLRDRPRLVPRARALAQGRHRPRHLSDRRHRNSVAGAEGAAGRAASPNCINEKKLPLVADVRDESAEDIRLVIEPRARTVDAELLMESLFKLTELESRIPLNMNVLVKGRIPKVIGLAEALTRMARPSPRGAAAALELPPRADRASARGARRLSRSPI